MNYLIKMQAEYSNEQNRCEDPFFFHTVFNNFQNDQLEMLGDMLNYQNADDNLRSMEYLISPQKDTQKDLVDKINSFLDLRSMHFNDIKNYVEKYYSGNQYDHSKLESAIRKKKLVLKRLHAKEKTKHCKPKIQEFPRIDFDNELQRQENALFKDINEKVKVENENQLINYYDVSNEDTETRKKKRNRMSAQISRDRRKKYITDLQKQADELKKNQINLKRENESLRQQLHAYQINEDSKQTKLIRLLVLIGVFYFIHHFTLSQKKDLDAKIEETPSECSFEEINDKIEQIHEKVNDHFKFHEINIKKQENIEELDYFVDPNESQELRDQSNQDLFFIEAFDQPKLTGQIIYESDSFGSDDFFFKNSLKLQLQSIRMQALKTLNFQSRQKVHLLFNQNEIKRILAV